ncbi:retinal guanylyl cyclase 1-like [Watersipora subatra]|uniref:retinal guanylyl cyclase 1-like n=1 Tax=Watersipora subatra TaxID=2589382 RepID=UPI00355C127E
MALPRKEERHLRTAYNNARCVSPTTTNSIVHMDKIIFSSEDLVWAMEPRCHDDATTVQSNSRRNTVNVKLLQKMAVEGRKLPGQRTIGPERSHCTIMSSTLSLDYRCTRQNIAYLKLRSLVHENINMFWGVYSDPYRQGFLFDFAKRGSLQEVLLQPDNSVVLDWAFKQALITDLVNGMRFLHRSSLRCHGNLQSTKCLIDHRWVLKVSGFGLSSLRERDSMEDNPVGWLWTAPEHLRDQVMTPTPKGDVYSFGIILQEVITETAPFATVPLEPEEILQKVKRPPPFCRPSVSNSLAPPPYIHMMKECWSESPDRRPSFDDIARSIRQMNKGKKPNIIDSILKKLEKYSSRLEEIVEDRTLKLEEEKKKTEQLLCRMLPPSVAEDLKAGNPVHPEHYDQVTIFFSDIVGFTTISAASTPIQIVNLLNVLYTKFDEIIGHHDVYKVETIGDAYMCVSGLPKRNGIRHAGEIATMALELLSAITELRVPHLPLVPLKLRIGCHSGHCAAGVVGLTMPRYCLFGDTVNTASRMESHSRADRIHLSKDTMILLKTLGGYHLKSRGQIEIKSKGKMETFWLIGKDGYEQALPPYIADEEEHANHGLESLLKEEELKQLIKEVSENVSPKHNCVQQLPHTSREHITSSTPRLPVPAVNIISNVKSALAKNSRTVSADALSLDKKALSNVHKVMIMPMDNDSKKQTRAGSSNSSRVRIGAAQSHSNLNL